MTSSQPTIRTIVMERSRVRSLDVFTEYTNVGVAASAGLVDVTRLPACAGTGLCPVSRHQRPVVEIEEGCSRHLIDESEVGRSKSKIPRKRD
jgi:hypothetical protein